MLHALPQQLVGRGSVSSVTVEVATAQATTHYFSATSTCARKAVEGNAVRVVLYRH